MNTAKERERIVFNFDLAGLRHVHHAYLLGVSKLILNEREYRRSVALIEAWEQMLIGSGYMSEAEVKAVHVVPKRFLTQDDAKMPT